MVFSLSAPLSYARGIRIWDYEDLVNDSDVVMIVSVFEPSKRTGTQEVFKNFKVDSVLTKFTVMAVVKGEYDSVFLVLHHHAYPEGHPRLNPLRFEWYDQINETFLVFLWMDDAGNVGPTAGYSDLGISIVKMVPNASQVPDAQSWGPYRLGQSYNERRLALRDPSADAKAFYDKGGFGFIMSYGDSRFPIGLAKDERLTVEDTSREFVDLKKYNPQLFSILSKLLNDPAGSYPVSGGVNVLRERYKEERFKYAELFNKTMASLHYDK